MDKNKNSFDSNSSTSLDVDMLGNNNLDDKKVVVETSSDGKSLGINKYVLITIFSFLFGLSGIGFWAYVMFFMQ